METDRNIPSGVKMDSSVVTWIITGLGFVLDTAIIALITAFITKRIDRRYEQRDKKEEERRATEAELQKLQEAEKIRKMEELMNSRCEMQVCTMKEEMGKVHEQLASTMSSVSNDLATLKDSTLCSLRDDILNSYWRCHDWQKFRTEWDTSNMESLYEQYHQLHGNSFVDHLMKDFYKVPLKNGD